MVELLYKSGKIKHLFYACIVSLLFTACTEDHSFSLDERRQIIVVHNLLVLEIESDSSQTHEGHFSLLSKKIRMIRKNLIQSDYRVNPQD